MKGFAIGRKVKGELYVSGTKMSSRRIFCGAAQSLLIRQTEDLAREARVSPSPIRILIGIQKNRDDRKEDATIRNDESALVIDEMLYYPKQKGIDFYHRFDEDLAMMEEIGLKAFRTSFDWSRIYPNGDEEEPNEEGLLYYDRLIASIRRR